MIHTCIILFICSHDLVIMKLAGLKDLVGGYTLKRLTIEPNILKT